MSQNLTLSKSVIFEFQVGVEGATAFPFTAMSVASVNVGQHVHGRARWRHRSGGGVAETARAIRPGNRPTRTSNCRVSELGGVTCEPRCQIGFFSLKQREAEAASREQTYQELLAGLEERNAALAQDQNVLQRSLAESRTYETKYRALRQEWNKQKLTQDVDVDRLDVDELKDYCLELRCRLDKAVKEVQ